MASPVMYTDIVCELVLLQRAQRAQGLGYHYSTKTTARSRLCQVFACSLKPDPSRYQTLERLINKGLHRQRHTIQHVVKNQCCAEPDEAPGHKSRCGPHDYSGPSISVAMVRIKGASSWASFAPPLGLR